jgi:hypothetical protein
MDSDQSSNNHWLSSLSRRDLFHTAGVVAGGAALLGLPKFIGNWMSEAEAAMPKRSATSLGHLALELEGQPASLLESVEGGHAFTEVRLEPPGTDLIQRKRPGPVRFEDIVIQVPLGGNPKSLTNWMMETLTKGPIPRNGAILYADFNNTEIRRLEFFNALLTEVSFPALDGASKDAASITLRITPQTTHVSEGKGKALQAPGNKSKPALRSNFRFNVQGLENACKRIAQVGSIVGKRPMAKVAAGQEKFRQPGSGFSGVLDCSTISLTLPVADAGPFYAWFDDVALKGNPAGERAGLLEWLSRDLNTVMGSLLFGGLGIVRIVHDSTEANSDKIQTIHLEMYCETITPNFL